MKKYGLFIIAGIIFIAGLASFADEFPVLLIDNFNLKDGNVLGGARGAYRRFPSQSGYSIVSEKNSGERILKIEYDKKDSGWCGYYSILKAGGRYLDASGYKGVAFRVKGEKGGETFQAGLADKRWEQKDDSAKSAGIEEYLGGKVTQNWQTAVIPFSDFGYIKKNILYSFVINFDQTEKGVIYIDSISLVKKIPEKPAKKAAPDKIIIDEFRSLENNLIGGDAGRFARKPSEIKAAIDQGKGFNGQSNALKIEYNRSDFGWCGYYSKLKRGERYFDASPYRAVSFYVKGDRGGEDFEVRVSDSRYDLKESSYPAGPVSKYLPHGITGNWQKVTVPFFDFTDIDFDKLASIVFLFPKEGKGTVYLSRITFEK